VRNGARLYAVDPRRTSSAQWADAWLGLDVGSDVALANAVGREIIAAGLANRTFIERATTGFEAYRDCVETYTLDYAERTTGVPAEAIRDLAHAYARADRAQLCWTLGITEHHNAVDNVLALINLALLTGHVGRYGSASTHCAGRTTCRAVATWARSRTGCPGARTWRTRRYAPRSSASMEHDPAHARVALSQMFEAMEHGMLRTVYVIGENPAQSEADMTRAIRLMKGWTTSSFRTCS